MKMSVLNFSHTIGCYCTYNVSIVLDHLIHSKIYCVSLTLQLHEIVCIET